MSENYIIERLDPQIKWYDEKSAKAKKSLFWLNFLSVICTSTISVLALFIDENSFTPKLLVALISQIINICNWYINFNKLNEIRINYRFICERLKTEKILFQNRCYPYDNEYTCTKLFISNCELLMDEEHKSWIITFKENKTSCQSTSS